MMAKSAARWVLGLALGFLTLASASAQQVDNYDTRRVQLSREELKGSVTRLEQVVNSQGYSDALRERTRRELGLLRLRLDEGDFQIGDRVVLQVQGHPALTDTFAVGPQRAIVLPGIGELSLVGVLRSELIGHLTSQLNRFIREPVVTATSMVRLQISGEVVRPGYYVIPSESLLGDALMLAGGPTRDADNKRMEVRRGDELITESAVLQQAVVDGRTLDQLNLRAGDQIVLGKQKGGIGGTLRAGALLISTVFMAIRVFM